ncbi:MAG: serine/threonine protein kinase, partial [Bradymonadaceae bacterium]
MSAADTVRELIAGRYEVLKKIGEGGQGVTWLARDRMQEHPVVLKEFSLKEASSLDALVFFEREARVLARQEHPRIPKYVDFFEDEGRFFLAQQFVEGKSLQALIEDGRRWTVEELQGMTRQVLEILAYLQAHSPPVIHRDIKPANLIMGDDGELVLVDFGAIHCLEQELHGAIHLVGTTGYMAPEQFTGRSLLATDLYSLGATIIHLASHRHPSELPREGLTLCFSSLVQLTPEFTRYLEILADPMAEDRFSNAKEALYWLESLESIENYRPGPGHELMTRAGPRGTQITLRRTDGELHIELPAAPASFKGITTIVAFFAILIGALSSVFWLPWSGVWPGLFLIVALALLVRTGLEARHHWGRLQSHRLEIGFEKGR